MHVGITGIEFIKVEMTVSERGREQANQGKIQEKPSNFERIR